MIALNMQLVRFLAVGTVNTLVGLALIYIGKFAGLGDASANATGYAICIALSFALNRSWTFRHSGSAKVAFIRFLAVIGAAYLANLAVVMCAIHVLRINHYVAQALGIPVYTVISYCGSKMYAFSTGRARGV